jgi:uncharacterized FAD-dependent dehydrogenase
MLRLNEIKIPLSVVAAAQIKQHPVRSDDHVDSKIVTHVHPYAALKRAIAERLHLQESDIVTLSIFKRAYDARKKNDILFIYSVDVTTPQEAQILAQLAKNPAAYPHVSPTPATAYQFEMMANAANLAPLADSERPVVIGLGPCGLFAALLLAQMGLRPIIIERGKAVRERTKDTFRLWRERVLTPESNVQFGEGGAGTFSDGKLYSQIKDPNHYGRKVLTEFVKAGAPEEILYISKPHIGTFRLVKMVENMRETITQLGGEYRFSSQVTDILIDETNGERQVTGVVINGQETLTTSHVVLAVGHSARDTFEMVHERGVFIEPKAFSIGFRVEHPQGLIDTARFGEFAGDELLGAADYKLVHHAKNGRAVYSFCMCPGGTVVAATSEKGRVVTNGMSQYSRSEFNANSGIVVGITPDDFPSKHPLAGIQLQRDLEAQAYQLGGQNYNAPAQLLGDFLANRPSSQLGSVTPSYKPDVTLTDLRTALPSYAIEAMQEAFPAFDKQVRGFNFYDAVLTGVETRTSSPIRITRHTKTLQSLNTQGLFPAGEGAGYAGGILSAGVDGIKIAEAVAASLYRSM